jgi:RNA polymerase sigma-70 factor (ECF subfamily)
VEEPEPALVRAAASGDVVAFERIVRTYQQHVWRFLRRLLADDALAEDVAQETFLRVHRRLGTFAFESKFSTWVFQIARNAGIDELRRRERRSRLASARPPAPAATGGTDARAELDAALASLPVDMREALVLIEVLGYRYHEAAALLGVPTGTVKSRVFHARLRLHRWSTADEPAAEGPSERGREAGREL